MVFPLQSQQAYTCTCCLPTECHDFVCLQADQGGSIDPSVFTDGDGKRWLLFKNDGNAVGQPTYIYSRPLSSDALQVLLFDKATLLGMQTCHLFHREIMPNTSYR